MSYSAGNRPPPTPHNDGRYSTKARAAAAVVRQRAQDCEPCWFWGRHPECPGPGWDWTLPHQHRWAYTVHHLDRLMDGGQPDPDPDRMAPAHRGCNARDGLHAQNARRHGTLPQATTGPATERTSRTW